MYLFVSSIFQIIKEFIGSAAFISSFMLAPFVLLLFLSVVKFFKLIFAGVFK